MKKYIFRSYIFIMIATILFIGVAFSYFAVCDIIKLEQKEILNTTNIIKNINKYEFNVDEFYNILEDNDTIFIFVDKNGIRYISTEKNYDFINSIDKILIEKFSNDTENNFYYYKNKICYIDYLKEDEQYIIAYKDFYILETILFDVVFCSFLVIALVYSIILVMRKNFDKNIIFPMKKIYKSISKIQKNATEPIFEESKFEEINDIYKAVNLIRGKTEDMFFDIESQNNKIEYILDNMNEGFVLFDKNRKVFTINKVAREILDCSHDEVGDNIIYYTKNMKIIQAIEKLFNEKKKCNFDIKTDNNKIFSVYINRIEKGIFKNEYNGGVMLLIDVTAQRDSEIIKQEFFSNVSHELKTPITSIQGYAELLYNDFAENKEQEKEFLKRIQKESQNITSLINNILTISRLENNFIEITKTNINISSMVSEIMETTRPLCLKNQVKIFNNCQNIEFLADYKMIHQLLNNLIVNAIKYNKKDGYVEVFCNDDENYIYITIKDSGLGIPLMDINRIFERFYRVKGRSKNAGGSGLGLSIVKHILNYYNGTIKIKSKENIGTEFFIKIPKN